MKIIIAITICYLASTYGQQDIQVLRDEKVVNPTDYTYAYELSNGVSAQERGELKGESLSVQGQFSFQAPEGGQYTVIYLADENGFQPQGDHLPTPPPVPEYIQRALDYIAAHPPAQK